MKLCSISEKVMKLKFSHKTWILILTIVCMLVALLLCRFTLSVAEIKVEAEIEAERPFSAQIFYTENEVESFNKNQVVSYRVPKGKSHLSIVLPISKLWQFRFDFGNAPGTVKVKNLELKGNILDFNNFTYNKYISDYKITGNELSITSTGEDPFIVYKEPLDLSKRIIVDWCMVIILGCFFFFVFGKLFLYLSDFKTSQQQSSIDIVFLTLFFGLLFIPMLHISRAEKSEQENRMLAPKAHLIQNGRLDNGFGTKFNDWFNDRFLGRNLLLNMYQGAQSYLSPSKGSEKVIVGKDGWLFYRIDGSPQNYANASTLSEAHMQKALAYFNDINDWCKKHNKQFYVLIAPDKNKIYGEYYPEFIKKIRSDDFSLGHQMVNYIRENSDVKIIYPYEELKANKDKGLLYFKHDTHWTPWGAYIGYQKLMDLMGIKPNKYNFNFRDKKDADLEQMHPSYPKDHALYSYFPDSFKNCEGDDFSFVHCQNLQGSKKVFMLRDSFARNLYPYMVPHFKEMFLYRRRNINPKDLKMILDNDVDIIIIEMVERYSARLSVSFPNKD